MPGVVSADLFERALPMLPSFLKFQSQKHVKSNSKLEMLAQTLLMIIMVLLMFLFSNDVFDDGFYVVCYENGTLVIKKDINICVEGMKLPTEPQTPEYLMLIIGSLFGLMFLINRIWRICFQSWIRQHMDDVIYEINDSLYRAMIVSNNPTLRCTREGRVYSRDLALHIEDISPMDSSKHWRISVSFVFKNVAYCIVAVSNSYKDKDQQCKIENRILVCTVPEYHTLKYIQIIAGVSCAIILLIILCHALYTFLNIKNRCNSFLKVYNCNIIPNYNYESLTLQCEFKAWGVILLYLEASDSLLMHYWYLNSMCRIQEIIDLSPRSSPPSNQTDFEKLKEKKWQALVDTINNNLSGWPLSESHPP
ncbi:uncharacterized protein [Heptranchias perlo]|uniref:uncharacterized protein n=1 Tax=Heptranchias perlo TaxID=212740 RepID=UPI00355994B7